MKSYVTSASVVAVKNKNKTVIGVDKLLSYGRMSRYYTNQIFVHNQTALAFSGEYADIQEIIKFIKEEEANEDSYFDSKSYFKMIQRYLYTMRSNFTPLNLECVIGGVDFLGYVDYLGNFYENDAISTKLGHHIVLPYLRESTEDPLIKVKNSLELLYKKDCKSSNEIQIAVITEEGVTISDEKIIVNWECGKSPEEILYV
ncbi:hypothetical protein H312_00345 [Anncaliia algerae PRA339]|uniref:Proteasome subunit beta n=1 Tax=Anncaliia algerae PRA339 TaxID=1288291 RepID=A0A059F5D8_9MICR|nr:hypothetical protein H312_00345 [Anncaliia algerae PRA339]